MAKLNLVAMLILLLCLLGLIVPISPATASPAQVKWSRVNIPTEGRAGNWVLANNSDVQHLTMAIDGSLYCYANPSGTSYTLFKSTDGGYSWSHTGKVKGTIAALATAPNDASTIYYATMSHIYKSTDAGSSFISLSPNPGGAGSNNIEITSIDVAPLDSNNIIAVGTRDTDNSQFGGVYILNENKPFTGWIDTSPGSYDVYAVAFSPNFTSDGQLVAVVTDEKDTLVTTKIGGVDWGEVMGDARLDKDNSGIPTSVVVQDSAAIAFPDDYSEDSTLFVAIDTDNNDGDVYMIGEAPGSSVATDLNIGADYNLSNIDVTSLAVTGSAAEANLMAGAAGSAQVYYSTDGGSNWTRSTKQPTGGSETCVVMAEDFANSGKAYAATSGIESGVSHTTDGGATWNQIGLVDTSISRIADLAPSPNYSQDNTLFMLTYGNEYSLWRSLDGGTRWERLLTSTLPDIDSISLVKLSPQYGNGSEAIFLVGTSNGNPAIWKSTDSGQGFSSPRVASFSIDVWAVANDNTLFIGSYDGSNGLIYRTTNGGLSYLTPAVAGNQSLNSIALSPNYSEDETLLIGNSDGWVYWSDDNGSSFEPLPPDAASSPLTGAIAVAVDPKFSSNHTIYAASDTANKGIYRFIIGTSVSWKSIDGTLPQGGILKQLVTSADGTLYATNFKADGGMERSLNPTYSLGPTFETVTRGLDDGATLTKLWLCDNQLWSIDAANIRLMTYTDSLTLPITLTSPPDNGQGVGIIINYTISNVSLDWETLAGATEYKWQLNYTTDFSTVPDGFEDDIQASSARMPALKPATIYYWRVRATEPVLSPWSAKWSFITSSGTEAIAPKLYSPEAGASGAGLKPIFQWSAVAGADGYELIVSTVASLTNPTILKVEDFALPGTAWECNINLNYDTTYYWKVRAISSDTCSAWSAVGAFTTEPPPSPPAQESPTQEPLPPSPPAPPQLTTPDWVKYLTGALLLTIVLLLITMVVLVKIVKRS